MFDWVDYAQENAINTVHGTLRIAHDIYSPQLNNTRDILVYLPPSYHTGDRHYPVIYMHDGQNLFDAHTSYAGEWHVDETMARLSAEGIEAIVVGIPNAEAQRVAEYNPYPTERFHHAQGNAYVRFIMETVKPSIDNAYRSLTDAAHTGIIGSSMGGLISLYAWLAYPHVFGLGGVMSPSIWVAPESVFSHVKHADFNTGRLYLDTGTAETTRKLKRYAKAFADNVVALRLTLEARGYTQPERLKFVYEEGGQHNESSWARRLPDALRFLLA